MGDLTVDKKGKGLGMRNTGINCAFRHSCAAILKFVNKESWEIMVTVDWVLALEKDGG